MSNLTIPPSTLSLREIWQRGLQATAVERATAEGAKLGTLRGGNSGCWVRAEDAGSKEPLILGKCGRLTHLRSLGYDEAKSDERQLMFGAGYDNEDEWLGTLRKGWDGVILREDEIPTKWTTTNGTVVTGRPDIVLCDTTGVPKLGLEKKLVSSLWTAYDVHYKYVPKTPHLVQAAHYAWQLGIPYKLVYTSRVDWHPPFYKGVQAVLRGKHDTVEKTPGEVFKILPFVREYDLEFRDGRLWYHTQGLTNPVQTFITTEGIREYYERVAQMSVTKDLGPRPSGTTAHGFAMSYHPCDFCALAPTCDAYESDYELWLDHARLELTSTTKGATLEEKQS